jgi:fructose-1,6-bisphosphatase II / sedoheptulose-1,7-bisphosphatase
MSDTAPLDRVFALEAVRVTEAAARATARQIGRGDELAADRAAGEAMRAAFMRLPISGTVIIGEGAGDETPILYTGEKLGAGGVEVDLALDPLEGPTLTAKSLPNALAVMVIADPGTLLQTPDIYMNKLAIGPGYGVDTIDLDAEPEEIVHAVARAKNVAPEDVTACVLDRPRHGALIEKLRAAGAAVHLISDGDVSGVMATTDPDTGIDFYIGQGGAAEGVLAACALRCTGGQFQARLMFRNDYERAQATALGISDLNRKYTLTDIVRGDVVFAATGVTDGAMMRGVHHARGHLWTESLVMRSATQTVRRIRARHRIRDDH